MQFFYSSVLAYRMHFRWRHCENVQQKYRVTTGKQAKAEDTVRGQIIHL